MSWEIVIVQCYVAFMLLLKAYRFRLKPMIEQLRVIEQTAAVVRFVWNSALALQKYRLDHHHRILRYAELCKELTAARNDPELAFLTQVHSKPEQQVLKDLGRAFENFFAGRAAFPRFKKKGRHEAFRHPERVLVRGRHVHIPGIGAVRFFKSCEVVGTIKNATVSRRGEHWYVSLQVEQQVAPAVHPARSLVGVDMGVARLATLSDGTVYAPLNSLRRQERKLSLAQRSLARKEKYSSNWHRQKEKIGRLHIRVADARRDYLHKTSTAISKSHAVVVVEELTVSNMSASARGTMEEPGRNVKAKSGLNKSILDQGWYELRRQLEYKQSWQGGLVVAVPPAGTSQRCSSCGHEAAASRRSQAEFVCVACGYAEHADLNAAKNIARAGHARLACGEGSLEPSKKQEPLAA